MAFYNLSSVISKFLKEGTLTTEEQSEIRELIGALGGSGEGGSLFTSTKLDNSVEEVDIDVPGYYYRHVTTAEAGTYLLYGVNITAKGLYIISNWNEPGDGDENEKLYVTCGSTYMGSPAGDLNNGEALIIFASELGGLHADRVIRVTNQSSDGGDCLVTTDRHNVFIDQNTFIGSVDFEGGATFEEGSPVTFEDTVTAEAQVNLTGQTMGTGTAAMTRDWDDYRSLNNRVRHWFLSSSHIQQLNGAAVGMGGGQASPGQLLLETNTTAGALAVFRLSGTNDITSPWLYPGDAYGNMSFDRRHRVTIEFGLSTSGLFTGNAVGRFWATAPYNYSDSNGATAEPAIKGFGFKVIVVSGTPRLVLQTHNGTTLTSGSNISLTVGIMYSLELDYFGGTLNATLNGTAQTAVTGGPSGAPASASNVTPILSAYSPDGSTSRCRWTVMGIKSLTTVS